MFIGGDAGQWEWPASPTQGATIEQDVSGAEWAPLSLVVRSSAPWPTMAVPALPRYVADYGALAALDVCLFLPAFGAESLLPLSAASAALPLTLPGYMSVLCVERMALETVGFLPIVEAPFATAGILPVRYQLQVIGVDALAHATEVVGFKAGWNRAHKQFVGEAVGQYMAAFAPKSSIALGICTRSPQPTGAEVGAVAGRGANLVDLGPEALFGSSYHEVRGKRVCRTVVPPAAVVHPAPRTRESWLFASRDGAGRLSSHRVTSGVMWPGVSSVAATPILPEALLPVVDYDALAALDRRDHPGTIEAIVTAAATGRVRELGGRITADEFRALLVVANWPAELHAEALAVACGVGNRSGWPNGESGCNPRTMGDGGRSYGLLQLNGETWAPYCGVTPADLLDPLINVRCGLEVYEYDIATGGPPWRQWSVKP